MAKIITLDTDIGLSAPLYVRINNISANNHGAPSQVLFRGYMSKDAFDAGKAFLWELEIDFAADPEEEADNLWSQGYAALTAYDPTLTASPDEKADAEALKAAIAAATDA